MELHIKTIVEAILLTSEAPVTPGRLTALLETDGKAVAEAVDALNAEYDRYGRAFNIVEVAGGFQLAVRKEFGGWVRRFQHEKTTVRLSQAALETLAIVAYRQPIIRPEIERIRGVNVGWVLRTLLERNLIRIAGRSDGVGRPLLYATTQEFMRYFGLKTTADLPKPEEIEDTLRRREGEQVGDEEGEQVGDETEQIPGGGGPGVPSEM